MTETTVERKYRIVVSVESSTFFTLKLDPTELNVDREDKQQLVSWELDAALKDGGGEFVDMSACKPGFEWLSVPPPVATIFDKASRPKKDTLEIRDTHKKGEKSDGTWLYRIRVKFNGAIYETPVAVDSAITTSGTIRILIGNNPIIINR